MGASCRRVEKRGEKRNSQPADNGNQFCRKHRSELKTLFVIVCQFANLSVCQENRGFFQLCFTVFLFFSDGRRSMDMDWFVKGCLAVIPWQVWAFWFLGSRNSERSQS